MSSEFFNVTNEIKENKHNIHLQFFAIDQKLDNKYLDREALSKLL